MKGPVCNLRNRRKIRNQRVGSFTRIKLKCLFRSSAVHRKSSGRLMESSLPGSSVDRFDSGSGVSGEPSSNPRSDPPGPDRIRTEGRWLRTWLRTKSIFDVSTGGGVPTGSTGGGPYGSPKTLDRTRGRRDVNFPRLR